MILHEKYGEGGLTPYGASFQTGRADTSVSEKAASVAPGQASNRNASDVHKGWTFFCPIFLNR